jgi:hypothetical protein
VQNDVGATQLINTYGANNHRLIEQVRNESSNQRTYYAWVGNTVTAEFEETAAAPTTPGWVKSYIYLGGRLLATIAPNGASERGRFTQADPIGMAAVNLEESQTLNLYGYCGNDPINRVDPSGLFFGWLKKFFGWIGKALHFIAIGSPQIPESQAPRWVNEVVNVRARCSASRRSSCIPIATQQTLARPASNHNNSPTL